MIESQVKDDGVMALLGQVAQGMRSPQPLMRIIAGLFEAEAEANFATQGRPR